MINILPRERIESALRHIEPDRTPIFEYVLLSPIADELLGRQSIDYAGDPDASRWFSFTSEFGWEKAVRQYAIDRVELAFRLDHDMMYVVPCPISTATLPDNSHDSSLQKEEDDPVQRVIQRNTFYERSNNLRSDESFLVYLYIKEELEKRDMDLPILAPACEHGVWTDTDLMQTMLLEPNVAHKHFSLATDRALKLIDQYIKYGIDQISVGGDIAGNRLIISPESYREFIVPEIRILSDYLHDNNKWAVNASDGNLWEIMDDFLIGCGVDGYLEIDMKAGMDLKRLKMAFGDQITFYGNMDCGNILSYSTPEEISQLTIQCIKDGYKGGGHIFCASNAITGSIPIRNYLAMVNAYRNYFGLSELKL